VAGSSEQVLVRIWVKLSSPEDHWELSEALLTPCQYCVVAKGDQHKLQIFKETLIEN